MFKKIKRKINKFLERLAKVNEETYGQKGPECCHKIAESQGSPNHYKKLHTGH